MKRITKINIGRVNVEMFRRDIYVYEEQSRALGNRKDTKEIRNEISRIMHRVRHVFNAIRIVTRELMNLN